MAGTKREYSLGIWAFSLGYFLFYIPYSGLTKAMTSGLIHAGGGQVSGFELLPSTVIATSVVMLVFVSAMGWWKYAQRREYFGRSVPFPRPESFVSGIAFAVIIGTTTLAYSFSGVSIVFALILMRGGVLILAPLVDTIFQRKVRWFSWAGLILSLAAVVVAFLDVRNYQLTIVAVLNLAAYLTGYLFRLPCMTRAAKTRDPHITHGYFAEEQLVAMPLLVMLPAILAWIDRGSIMHDLRLGFTAFFHHEAVLLGLLIGSLYAALGVFGTLIYLDRRENTFCIPLNRCASLLSGIVASYVLRFLARTSPPSHLLLLAVGLVMAALLVLSPLHHLPLYIKQLRDAIAEKRLVLLTIVKDGSGSTPDAPHRRRLNFITINLDAVRDIWRKAAA